MTTNPVKNAPPDVSDQELYAVKTHAPRQWAGTRRNWAGMSF